MIIVPFLERDVAEYNPRPGAGRLEEALGLAHAICLNVICLLWGLTGRAFNATKLQQGLRVWACQMHLQQKQLLFSPCLYNRKAQQQELPYLS